MLSSSTNHLLMLCTLLTTAIRLLSSSFQSYSSFPVHHRLLHSPLYCTEKNESIRQKFLHLPSFHPTLSFYCLFFLLLLEKCNPSWAGDITIGRVLGLHVQAHPCMYRVPSPAPQNLKKKKKENALYFLG